jgi:large subunit ribosomal protein L19
MQNALLELVEKTSLRESVPDFEIGDTVDVHVRILEGDKERIQIFNGVVIARSGGGVREVFTVRRIVAGEGVERSFPVHSPRIANITVKRSGKVRRAKLYYLRDRVGKAVRLKERVRGKASEAEAAAARVQKREARKVKKAAKLEARAQRASEGPKPKGKPAAEGESTPAEGAE